VGTPLPRSLTLNLMVMPTVNVITPEGSMPSVLFTHDFVWQLPLPEFTITPPRPERTNLLANVSFEYPDSSSSPVDWGCTYYPHDIQMIAW
jgi:hypothetical protein